jgi:hypothetical protein
MARSASGKRLKRYGLRRAAGGRHNRRRKANALGAFTNPITHARALTATGPMPVMISRSGQVSVPHQSLTAVVDPPFAHKWRTEP